MEFMRFQLAELHQADLQAGEQETLESELQRLSNAESIKTIYGAAYNQLTESELNLSGQIRDLIRSMSATRKLDSRLADIGDRLESLLSEVQDIAQACDRIAEQTDLDPQRIHEVQERLNLLYRLQKKHQAASVEDLLDLRQRLETQTAGYANLDADIAELERRIAEMEIELRQQATVLTEKRAAVVEPFEKRVQSMLSDLSMPHARLKVAVEPTTQLTPTGCDDVQFLFASNVGSRFLPIKDVASGGELSRLNLCTKSIVADAIPLPTLIFDEIDAGVSGDVSMKMGAMLRELAERHQVICITHTPQVAARAHRHYFIYKTAGDQRTVTNVRLLDANEQIRAIAVMLSGNPPSESALATAREMCQ